MGWLNAIGNIILALAVAYLPLIPLSFVWSVADPIHGSSMATIIGGFWFMIVFGSACYVIDSRKRLLGEESSYNINDDGSEVKTSSIYARRTMTVMLVVVVISFLAIIAGAYNLATS